MLKSNKFIAALLGASAVIFAFANFANAADLRFGGGQNQSIFRVEASDSVRNLYAAGPQLIVDANSSKDAVVAGGSVTVNGNTADDLIVAGGNVSLKGKVGGSARVAGGSINVDGKITEDLVIAGGSVYISPNASIGGDLVVVGGNVILDGPVAGTIRGSVGVLEINNSVGAVDATVTRGLTLDRGANIRGDLNYKSPVEYRRDAKATVGGNVNYTVYQPRRSADFGALLTVAFLLRFLAELVAAFLLFYLFRNRFTALVEETRMGVWKNLGIGFLVLVLLPVLIITLMVTVLGIYTALILGAIYFLMLMIAGMIGSAALGSWLLSRVNEKQFRIGYGPIALGLLVIAILKLIPILGWLFVLAVMLVGLGAVARRVWNSRSH